MMRDADYQDCSKLGHLLYTEYIRTSMFQILRCKRARDDNLGDINDNVIPFYTDISQMLLEFYENHDTESSIQE